MISFMRLNNRSRQLQRLHLLRQKVQQVSTWTPLENYFNSKPDRKINILKNETVSQLGHKLQSVDSMFTHMTILQGLLGIPELRTHEGFYLLKENVINKSDRLIEEAISPNRARKIVEIFDELSDSLCKVADMAEFVRLAHPVAAYASAAEDACISVSGVVEK